MEKDSGLSESGASSATNINVTTLGMAEWNPHLITGRVFFANGEVEAAVEHFTRGLEVNPGNAEIQGELAFCKFLLDAKTQREDEEVKPETQTDLKIVISNNESSTSKIELDLNELMERSREGSVTARNILKSLKKRSRFLKMWKELETSNEKELVGNEIFRVQLVDAMYNCYGGEFQVLNIYCDPDLVRFLDSMMDAHEKETSDLDRKLRVLYGRIMLKSDETRREILLEGIRRYPEEIPLYHRLCRCRSISSSDYKKTLDVVTQGLTFAPCDTTLLYYRAFFAHQFSENERQRANGGGGYKRLTVLPLWKDFIDQAPQDHPLLPEAFYCLAYQSWRDWNDLKRCLEHESGKGFQRRKMFLDYMKNRAAEIKQAMISYLEMGEDAEKNQLSHNLPYGSKVKDILKDVRKNEKLEVKVKDDCHESFLESVSTFRISVANASSIQLKKDEDTPVTLEGSAGQSGMLNVILVKHPVWILKGPSWYAHTLAKVMDEKGERVHLNVHNLLETEMETFLEYGSKFMLANPTFRGNNTIYVEKPDETMIKLGTIPNMCRYCTGSRHYSKFVWGGYCSRECQLKGETLELK